MLIKQSSAKSPKGSSANAGGAGAKDTRKMVGLVVVILIALCFAGYYGKVFFNKTFAERQEFGTSSEILKAFNDALPPGYAPYGRPLKPGEKRPIWGTYLPKSFRGKPVNASGYVGQPNNPSGPKPE
jgi:hypothetical protein